MADYLDELVQKIMSEFDARGFVKLDQAQKKAMKGSARLGDRMERDAKRTAKANNLMGASLKRAFGIFFGIQGVRSVIQTTRDLDLLQKSIKGLTGSVEDWQYLRQEAYRTGTSLKTIAGAYKNFYSAARGSGFNGNQIQGMFSGLLTAGRGIGASQQQIGGALVALEQMLSKGKVSAEELRRQLGNALPGAVEIAQRAMGVTGAQFEEMMKKGISAAEFVPKFIAQAEKELGKGFKENIKSLDFALVNLNTAWMEFQANILQGEAGEALAQLVRDVTKILRSQELLNFIKLISKALEKVIKHLKIFLELFAAKKIMEIVRAVKAFNWEMLDLATNTEMAGTYAQKAAEAYSYLFSEANIKNAVGLGKSLWALAAPLLKVWAILKGIEFILKVIQDLWLFFTDPEAITVTGYLANHFKENSKLKNIKGLKGVTAEQRNQAAKYWGERGKRLNFKPSSQGKDLWDLESIDDFVIKDTVISAPKSGGISFDKNRMPIFNSDIQTPAPRTSYNSSSNYQNSLSQNQGVNLTINVTAQSSDPNAIATAIKEPVISILGDFMNSYNLGYNGGTSYT